MEEKYLYEKIYETIKKEILNGIYDENTSFPSERILAERFQASHLTIRKALQILVDEGLIERKSGIGTIVLPRQSQQGHIRMPVGSVSVILDSIEEFFGAFLSKLESELHKRHIKMIVYCHHGNRHLEREVYSRASQAQDSVILFFGVDNESPWLAEYDAASRTIVSGSSGEASIPQVHTDDENGSLLAVTSLINLGYQKIAHISSDFQISGELRKSGYLAACAAAGMAVDDGLMENGSYSVDGGYSACKKIMKTHPDCRAFFCANDHSAYGTINCLSEYGLRFGEDYSIIGFGNLPSSKIIRLSSVDQNVDRLIACHVILIEEYMLKGSIHSERYLVPTELIVRDSCIRAQMIPENTT